MYKDILLPVDLDDATPGPLPAAVELARTYGATLHVMAVMPAFELPMVSQYFPAGHEQRMRDELLARLHAFVAANVPKEVRTQAIVGEGRVYLEILRVAKELKVDLIVIGSHRPELRDFLLGSNARKVANHADCSVLLVR